MSQERERECSVCGLKPVAPFHFYVCTTCGDAYCIRCAKRHRCNGPKTKPMDMEANNAALRAELAEANRKCEYATKLNFDLGDRLHEMQYTLGNERKELTEKTAEVERLLDGNVALLARNIELSNQLTALEQQLAEKTAEVERLYSEKNQFRSLLYQKATTIDGLRQQLAAEQAARKELEGRIGNALL